MLHMRCVILWPLPHFGLHGCSGYQAEAGQRLQPYSDQLVYSAAIALPWMAPELQQLESDPEGLTAVESSIEQYLGLRQQDTQLVLNAFPVTGPEDGAAASLSGTGVAGFLPEVCSPHQSVSCCHGFHWIVATMFSPMVRKSIVRCYTVTCAVFALSYSIAALWLLGLLAACSIVYVISLQFFLSTN